MRCHSKHECLTISSSGQATANSLLRHPRLLACHSGAALGGKCRYSTFVFVLSDIARVSISSLLQQPEGPTLEFKASLPRLPDLAKLVAGFANCQGGKILIGYDESTRKLQSVDEGELSQAVDRVQRILGGDVLLSLSFTVYDGNKLPVLEVPRSQGLVGVDGSYFVRTGATTQLMNATDIRQTLVQNLSPQQSLDQLAAAVARQSEIIEQIRSDLNNANSPVNKIGIALVGAAAGTLGKRVIEFALSLL